MAGTCPFSFWEHREPVLYFLFRTDISSRATAQSNWTRAVQAVHVEGWDATYVPLSCQPTKTICHDLELQYAVHDGRKHARLQSFHANNVVSTTAECMHVLRITSATPAMYACHLSWIIVLRVFGLLPFHRVGTSPNLKTVRSSTVSG